MKITDLICELGEACKGIKLSTDYDVTEEISNEEGDKPHFLWHFKGSFSVKIVKLIASIAIFAIMAELIRAIRSLANAIRGR